MAGTPANVLIGLVIMTLGSMTLRVSTQTCPENDQCLDKIISVSGDVRLIVLASLHHPGTSFQCGDISHAGIQALVALQWTVNLLNGAGNSSNAYIPGVKIGYDVYDDCGLSSRAVDGVLELLPGSKFPDLLTCSNFSENRKPYLGFILATTSNATQSASDVISDRGGIISVGTRLSTIENKPNVFFTQPKIQEYVQYTINAILQLEWYYIALIHTSDSASMEFCQKLKRAVWESSRSCINTTYTIGLDVNDPNFSKRIENILSGLRTIQVKTEEERLGVLFVGETNIATKIIDTINSNDNLHAYNKKFQWLFASGVGHDLQFQKSAKLSMTKYPDTVYIAHSLYDTIEEPDFKTYLNHEMQNPDSITKTPWMEKYQESLNVETNMLKSYVPDMKHSVLIFAGILKSLVAEYCQGKDFSTCDELIISLPAKAMEKLQETPSINDFEPTLNVNSISIEKESQMVSVDVPRFHNFLKFDSSLNIFKKIGGFDPVKNISEQLIKSNSKPSSCKTNCPSCFKDRIEFFHIPGDFLILGLFSLTESKPGSFQCGKPIEETEAYLTVLAFLEEVRYLGTIRGQKFGALALNDCYDSLNISSLLLDLFSKNYFLHDSQGKPIDMDKVRFAVGPLSSGVTMLVVDILTKFHIPLISYGASSALLDDRRTYPYFLRTVPSDSMQSKAITELMTALNITFSSAVYIDNSYGINGILDVKQFAQQEHICLYDVQSVVIGYDGYGKLKQKLFDNGVKVIVFYGTLTTAKEMLDAFNANGPNYMFIYIASEAWGNSDVLLHSETKGSLVFNTGTIAPLNNNFKNYLYSLSLQNTLAYPQLDAFWELAKGCSLRWSPEKPDEPTFCDDDLSIDSAMVDQYANMQRILHVTYAVQSIFTACDKTSDCVTAPLSRSHGLKMYNALLNVTLMTTEGNPMKPFARDGNGAHGFTINNIRKRTDSTLYYKEVGKYTSDNGLSLDPNTVRFYNDKDKEIHASELKDVECSSLYCNGICKLPETTTKVLTLSTTTPNIYLPEPTDSNAFDSKTTLYILIGFLCLLLIIIALLVVFIVFIMRQGSQIKQLSEITTQSQVGRFGGSTANIYDITHYDVPKYDSHSANSHSGSSGRHIMLSNHSDNVQYSAVNVIAESERSSSKNNSNSSGGMELSTILQGGASGSCEHHSHFSSPAFEDNSKTLNYLSANDLLQSDGDNEWSDENEVTNNLFDSRPTPGFHGQIHNQPPTRPKKLHLGTSASNSSKNVSCINQNQFETGHAPHPHTGVNGGYLHVVNDNKSNLSESRFNVDNKENNLNTPSYIDPVKTTGSFNQTSGSGTASFSNPVCDSPDTSDKLSPENPCSPNTFPNQQQARMQSLHGHQIQTHSSKDKLPVFKISKNSVVDSKGKIINNSPPSDSFIDNNQVQFYNQQSKEKGNRPKWTLNDIQTDEVII